MHYGIAPIWSGSTPGFEDEYELKERVDTASAESSP